MSQPGNMEEIINDLRDVCKKHGVVIVGNCDNEGIYGELLIECNDPSKYHTRGGQGFNTLWKSAHTGEILIFGVSGNF